MSRFDLDLDAVTTERLICPQGVYSARIAKAALATGVKNDRNWAMLNITYAIKDVGEGCVVENLKGTSLSSYLGVDEPKVFGTIPLSFDKDTEKLTPNNPELGVLLEVVGLKNDQGVAIFKEGTEEATSQWQYNTIYFTNLTNTLAGYDVLVSVTHRKNYNDPTRMDAVVSKIAKLES